MRLMTIAAVSAVALASLTMIGSASAQSPRNSRVDYYGNRTETITVIDEFGRRHTRITVRPRSFLDPGTAQTYAYEHHYHDYAVPPQTYFGEYFASPNFRNDWKTSWSRMPFPSCFDAPGMCR
jgi:hypothetical protein